MHVKVKRQHVEVISLLCEYQISASGYQTWQGLMCPTIPSNLLRSQE